VNILDEIKHARALDVQQNEYNTFSDNIGDVFGELHAPSDFGAPSYHALVVRLIEELFQQEYGIDVISYTALLDLLATIDSEAYQLAGTATQIGDRYCFIA
jgi:hypothetical protein